MITKVGECFECGEYAVIWNPTLENGRGRAECKCCGALKPKYDNPLSKVVESMRYMQGRYGPLISS